MLAMAGLVLCVQLAPTAIEWCLWDWLLPVLLGGVLLSRWLHGRLTSRSLLAIAVVTAVSFSLALDVAIPNVEFPAAEGLPSLIDDGDRSSSLLTFEGVIVEARRSESGGARLTVQLRSVERDVDSEPRGATGVVSLSLRYASRDWALGHCVRFRSRLRLIRNAGNEGEFDWAGWNARRGVRASAFVWSDRDLEDQGACATGLLALRAALGRAASAAMTNSAPAGLLSSWPLSRQAGGVIAALLTGDRSRVTPEVARSVRNSGMAHAMAISGLHLGLLAAAVFFLVERPLRRNLWFVTFYDTRRPAAVAAAFALTAYASLAGGGLSVLRAGVMGCLALAAVWRGMPVEPLAGLRGLAWAAIATALIAPGAIRETGFRLSYVAVAALVCWATRLSNARQAQGRQAHGGAAILVAAIEVGVLCQAITLPLVVQDFGEVPRYGLFANLVGASLVWATTLLALLGAVLWASGLELLANWVFVASSAVAGVWLELCAWVASLPGAVWRISTPPVEATTLLLVTVLSLCWRSQWSRHCSVCCGCVALALCWQAWAVPSALEVDFLSVGQGDATVIRSPSGAVMVVDAGLPGRGNFAVAPWLRRRGIGTIDVLVATHADLDHSGGLAELIEQFSVGELWLPREGCRRGPLADLVAKLPRTTHVRAPTVRAPTVMSADPARASSTASASNEPLTPWAPLSSALGPGVNVQQLWPVWTEGPCAGNNESLAFRVEFAGRSVLLAADIEAQAERGILQQNMHLRADVLKLPHHGSRSSTTSDFLAAVAPQAAVASLGWRNRFGFPHPEVVERLEAIAVPLLRSDRDGSVSLRIEPDGTVTLTSFRASTSDDTASSWWRRLRTRVSPALKTRHSEGVKSRLSTSMHSLRSTGPRACPAERWRLACCP